MIPLCGILNTPNELQRRTNYEKDVSQTEKTLCSIQTSAENILDDIVMLKAQLAEATFLYRTLREYIIGQDLLSDLNTYLYKKCYDDESTNLVYQFKQQK